MENYMSKQNYSLLTYLKPHIWIIQIDEDQENLAKSKLITQVHN